MPTLVTFAVIYIFDIDSHLRRDGRRKKEVLVSLMVVRLNDSAQST